MTLPVYVKIDIVHKKIVNYLQDIDELCNIPHRHRDAVKALRDDHHIHNTTHIFLCWLDEAKTIIGIRFPADLQLAHLQFHAYNENEYVRIIDVSKQPLFYRGMHVEQRQPDEIMVKATVRLASDRGYGGIPSPAIEQLRLMPVRLALQQQRIEEVRQRTQLGRMYLEHVLQKAEKESFSVSYINCTLIRYESLLRLAFDKHGMFAQIVERIKNCERGGHVISITEGNDEERQKIICSGKIRSANYKDAILTLTIEKNGVKVPPEELEQLYNEGIHERGNLTYSTLGDLPTQRKALERLERDEARMPNLDLLLYGDNTLLSLKGLPEAKPLPPEQCLNRNINEEQRRAVSRALAAPDFFLMQGPPGTGKTTFIAELCYQLVKVGQKVLVSSQSNLAVDNALSRLESHHEILAIRLGLEDKFNKEASDFVGDNAVRRWMRSIAKHSQERLQHLRNVATLSRFFVHEWDEIMEQLAYVSKYQELNKKRATLHVHIQEDEKQIVDIASTIQLLDQSEEEIKVLKQELEENTLIGSAPPLWPRLRALYPRSDIFLTFDTRDNPWTQAEQIQKWRTDLTTLLGECRHKLDENESIYNYVVNERQKQQEITDDIQKIQSSLLTQEQKRRDVTYILLHQKIGKHVGNIRYESSNYTDLERRIGKANTILSDENTYARNYRFYQEREMEEVIDIWINSELQGESSKAEKSLNEIASELSRLRQEFADAPFFLRELLPSKRKLSSATVKLTEGIQFLINVIHNFGDEVYKSYPLCYRLWKDYLNISQKTAEEIEYTRQLHTAQKQRALTQQQDYNTFIEEKRPFLQKMKSTSARIQELLGITSIPTSISGSNEDVFLIENNILHYLQSKLQEYAASILDKQIPSLTEGLVELRQWIVDQSNELKVQQEHIRVHIKSQKEGAGSLDKEIEALGGTVQVVQKDLSLKWNEVSEVNLLSPDFIDEGATLTTLTWQTAKRQWLDSIGGTWERQNLDKMIAILEDWVAMVGESEQNGNISSDIWNLFLQSANVIGATCAHSGTTGFLRNFSEFDVVIVDEVSKATPTELLIPCLLAKKIILVGDHKQLPPVLGKEAKDNIWHIAEQAASSLRECELLQEDIERHLFSSVFKDRFEYLSQREEQLQRTIMLTKQYRMHSHIMNTINQFYKGALELGDLLIASKREHGLQIPLWLPRKEIHVVWIDLPREWKHNQLDGGGRDNPQEARLIIYLLRNIFYSWQHQGLPEVEPLSIGVISMYRKQAGRIRSSIKREREHAITLAEQEGRLSIGTVDEFQGMEKDIIFLSLVVNESDEDVRLSDFLCTAERINVAMSRARRLLVIVGSTHNYIEVKSKASLMYENVLNVVKDVGYYVKADNEWLKEAKQ